jgi:hypothetical protein
MCGASVIRKKLTANTEHGGIEACGLRSEEAAA